jgi:hypothetical protein
MNLKDIRFTNAINEDPPGCVLSEPLEKHLPNLSNFSSVVLALTFDSGPPENRTARSYVFYFFDQVADPNRRPDDILTFKVRFDDPLHVHIVDKYLGGMAFGAENAPPLANRHLWRPGLISKEGKESFRKMLSDSETKKQKSGCFIATAVYGSVSASEVVLLKAFRDNILQKTLLGRMFVWIYYRLSPFLAITIRKSECLKKVAKILLIEPALCLVKCFEKSENRF